MSSTANTYSTTISTNPNYTISQTIVIPVSVQKPLVDMSKYKISGYLPTENVYMKEVIYSNPATVVFWSDGTKTVSKCHSSDTYSEETGLMLCILKKLIGSTSINNILNDWVPEQTFFTTQKVTLADLLRKYK